VYGNGTKILGIWDIYINDVRLFSCPLGMFLLSSGKGEDLSS